MKEEGMKGKLRWVCLALAVFLLCAVTGLDAAVKDTLVVANTSGEPGNLHPYNTVSIGQVLISESMMEPLVYLDEEGEYAPRLAVSWDINDKSIVFHIREGVLFHNGEALVAEDVAFSLQEVMLKSTGGLASQFDSVDAPNIVAVDKLTVKVPLKVPDSTVLSNLTGVYIVSKKAYQELGNNFQYKPVGTGPFLFAEWQVGDHVTVKRFDKYWGGAAKLKTVMFRTIKEAAQAMIELQTGGVDIVINPQGKDIEQVLQAKVPGVQAITKRTAMLRNNNLNFNWLSPTMANRKVREAIARVIDRKAWTPIISPGNGSPAYSNLPAGVWGSDPSIAASYPYQFDVARAKQLMVEAGYPNGFDAVLLSDERPYHLALIQLAQAALKQININVKVQTMDLAQQKQIMVTGKGFDLYILDNVGNAADPLSPIWRDSHPRFAKENSSHYHFYTVKDAQGQKYSDLMDAIRVTMDDKKRLQLVRDLQKVFVEDIVWLPINTIQGYVLAGDKVTNVAFKQDILRITKDTSFK